MKLKYVIKAIKTEMKFHTFSLKYRPLQYSLFTMRNILRILINSAIGSVAVVGIMLFFLMETKGCLVLGEIKSAFYLIFWICFVFYLILYGSFIFFRFLEKIYHIAKWEKLNDSHGVE